MDGPFVQLSRQSRQLVQQTDPESDKTNYFNKLKQGGLPAAAILPLVVLMYMIHSLHGAVQTMLTIQDR